MEKLRKLEKEKLKEIITSKLKNEDNGRYCCKVVQDVLRDNKINMDNITKRVLKHFEDRIKDNDRGFSVYYEKVDRYTCVDYILKFYIHEWDENKKEWYNFTEHICLKTESYYNGIENLTIEKLDERLQYIDNNIAYYNNLLENLDLIVEENNRIYDQYMEFLSKYSDDMYNKLTYIIESDKYY